MNRLSKEKAEEKFNELSGVLSDKFSVPKEDADTILSHAIYKMEHGWDAWRPDD